MRRNMPEERADNPDICRESLNMIEIDGSKESGSGTIVRFAVALAALTGERLHLFNARAKRGKPGLRPQHLTAVLACGEMCGGRAEGLGVGCQEFTFAPGRKVKGGDYAWDIGTAGSATMLALCVLPVACFADTAVTVCIRGGVFQDFAPSPHHMQHVLAPLLERMNAVVELQVIRAGYVPKGAGAIKLSVKPVRRSLKPVTLPEQGSFSEVSGIAFSSHLEQRHVSERMAEVCEQRLARAGLSTKIERLNDSTALHAGASLAIWAESSTGCVLGADRAGALRRSSEAIGEFVAGHFLSDLATGATVDEHVADQLVPFAALADGASHYIIPRRTEHLESNLWLADQFGAKVERDKREVVIEGVGHCVS